MYETEKKRLASMAEFEKNKEKSVQRRHSALLVADSLTNLASMYARSKGALYSMGTNFAAPHTGRLYEARENSAKAQRNYNALMTEIAFRKIIDASNTSGREGNMPTVGKRQVALGGNANRLARKHSAGVISARDAVSRWGRVLNRKK